MAKKTRRRFSDEFKVDAVSLVTDQEYSVSEAARRQGLSAAYWIVGAESTVTSARRPALARR